VWLFRFEDLQYWKNRAMDWTFFLVVYIIVCFMHVSVAVWLDSIVYVAV
jgi:hypothetical protein